MHRRLLRSLTLTLLLFSRPALAATVFDEFLTDDPPQIVETVSHQVKHGVEVTRLKFLSRVDQRTGREVIITGYLTRPTTPGPHPGILVCHGGGGYAEQVAPQAIGWAQKGYVSVCQDEPGIYTASKGDSSGPNSDPGASTFKYAGDIRDSALYDGVCAALRGLALLRSQPDVDKSRVGVTGGSWGGYMTTMVCGLAGERVKACFAVYGCGFYDRGSTWQPSINALGEEGRKAWLDNLDAGRHADNIQAAYMVATASNDWFFWPSAMMATYHAAAGPKNILWSPNDSHALNLPGGTHSGPPFNHGPHRTWLEQCWLNYQLKGEGEPFPKVVEAKELGRQGHGLLVEFRADASLPLEYGQVWYAAGELPWRLKWWASVPTETLDYGYYRAIIPITEPDQPVQWFGTVNDSRQCGSSSLIRTVQPADYGLLETGPGPGLTIDFEDPSTWRRVRRQYLERRSGRLREAKDAAHRGEYGLALTGPSAATCFGIRAATIRRTGAKALTLAVRAAAGTAPCPNIELVAEEPDGHRHTWGWDTLPETVEEAWQTLTLPLSEAICRGKHEPPFPLLSEHLGLLLLEPAKDSQVYVDDIAFR